MKRPLKLVALSLLALSAASVSAYAHRTWLLPSATILAGKDNWVTVDAAVSNDLFYFEHRPLNLDNLSILAPDGTTAAAENIARGRYRNTFDVRLTQSGTYKMMIVNKGAFASFKLDGQTKRLRGEPETIAGEIPAGATDVRLSELQGRIEIFVTSGKPTDTVLKTTGAGLELVPVTHPNNLVVGEKATFRMTLDGQPAPGLNVEIVPGGIRYRDKLNDQTVTTDESGTFSVTWPAPGMYWLHANVRDDKSRIKDGVRRASYTTTVEVLPP